MNQGPSDDGKPEEAQQPAADPRYPMTLLVRVDQQWDVGDESSVPIPPHAIDLGIDDDFGSWLVEQGGELPKDFKLEP